MPKKMKIKEKKKGDYVRMGKTKNKEMKRKCWVCQKCVPMNGKKYGPMILRFRLRRVGCAARGNSSAVELGPGLRMLAVQPFLPLKEFVES